MPSEQERNIGRYQLRRRLGAAGGIEVLLATDPLFDRFVVLQLIPLAHFFDQASTLRCRQDVLAVARLNHSNIARVFDLSEVDHQLVIISEYVEGRSLDKLLGEKNFQLPQVLDIALQMTGALVAAHGAELKHGHLRPEVVMLQPDGNVKLIDFGLACLRQNDRVLNAAGQDLSRAKTFHLGDDDIYQAPEHAQGLSLDARADLWGVGCILYQLLAGAPPPQIAKTEELMTAVINNSSVSGQDRHIQKLATELELVVRKALNPDREERYQTAKEMLGDLRHLQKSLEHTYTPESGTKVNSSSIRKYSREFNFGLNQSAPNNRLRAIFFSLVVLLAIATAAAFYFYRRASRPANLSGSLVSTQMRLTRLTATGNAREAAISPDGKNIAYIVNEEGRQSIWLRMVDAVSARIISPPVEGNFYNLFFSADGNYVVYSLRTQNQPPALYQLPTLGGTPQKILDNVPDVIVPSPDQKRYAFIRQLGDGESALVVGDPAVESDAKVLTTRKSPDFIASLAWSPDGRGLACAIGRFEGALGMNIVNIDAETGAESLLTQQSWGFVRQLAWLPDGGGILVLASDQALGSYQIWLVSLLDGGISRVTNDLYNYGRMSVTQDATTIVTDASNVNSSVWLAAIGEAGGPPPKRITRGDGTNTDYWGIAFTPGNKLIYESTVSGAQDLWLVDPNNAEPKQLTTKAGNNFDPAISLDGRYIVFSSTRGGAGNIWRIDADGTNPKQLTSGKSDNIPAFSPDGRWVIYASFDSNLQTLRKVSIDGGESVRLTEAEASWPAVSPDGKLIACWYREQPGGPSKLAVIPFDGGPPTKAFEVGPTINTGAEIRWTFDGRALAYIDTQNGVSNILMQPIEGGTPKRLTNFAENKIYRFDLSRDGKQLAYSRGMGSSDIVLIKNFK